MELTLSAEQVSSAELREAVGIYGLLAQDMGEPEGHSSGYLDLHQAAALGQELFALGVALQADVVVARGDLAVEGYPQLGIVDARQSQPAVADEGLGVQTVAAYHVVDLGRDVAGEMPGQAAGQDVAVGLVAGHGYAALVDDALIFLLDLEEHRGLRLGRAVGTQPELLLIRGLRERGLDQLVGDVVEVDVADDRFAELILAHIWGEARQYGFVLLLGEQIFLFNSLEDVGEGHVEDSFRQFVLDYGYSISAVCVA